MDFEIEDDDDPYDFQSNWSKPSKDKGGGGFGFGFESGKGDNNGDDDAYNYDFGAIKEETTHYSGSEEKSKKSFSQSAASAVPVEKSKPKPAAGGNAMEKAAAMLDRYSGKSAAKKTTPGNAFKHTNMDFDEDDISISMGSDDSYEDSYPSNTKKKKTFEPDSPLYSGLDSDIPRMKNKSQFKSRSSSSQEPTIKGQWTGHEGLI
jgi:hypothetical protein